MYEIEGKWTTRSVHQAKTFARVTLRGCAVEMREEPAGMRPGTNVVAYANHAPGLGPELTDEMRQAMVDDGWNEGYDARRDQYTYGIRCVGDEVEELTDEARGVLGEAMGGVAVTSREVQIIIHMASSWTNEHREQMRAFGWARTDPDLEKGTWCFIKRLPSSTRP